MEDKIKELEERIEKLEKIENRRKVKNILLLSFYGTIVIILIACGFYFYYKFKPYKEKLDSLQSFTNGLKRDEVIDGDNGFNYDFGGLDGYEDFFNQFFN